AYGHQAVWQLGVSTLQQAFQSHLPDQIFLLQKNCTFFFHFFQRALNASSYYKRANELSVQLPAVLSQFPNNPRMSLPTEEAFPLPCDFSPCSECPFIFPSIYITVIPYYARARLIMRTTFC